MALIPVEEALQRLLEGAGPLGVETVPLREAAGRVVAEPVVARRTQPPFAASAMDGYAVRADDTIGNRALRIVGEIPAGHAFDRAIRDGEAVRIFTGAPVPEGADAILIQENAERDGALVRATTPATAGQFIRPAGLDFSAGEVLIGPGSVLDFRAIALAAAMNYADLTVYRRPRVAILPTGDELVEPGSMPGPNQIVASNTYGVAALAEATGAVAVPFPIARDDPGEIGEQMVRAITERFDVLVTLGGASVGDHDLIKPVLGAKGLDLKFWRIAMRPGKPLMFGMLGDLRVVGLPGNPVSSLACAILFLEPLIARLGGRACPGRTTIEARLGRDVSANDQRQDYLRAELARGEDGQTVATPFALQDSSVLSLLHKAGGLVVRKPFAPAAKRGETVSVIPLTDRFRP